MHNLIIKVAVITINNETRKIVLVYTRPGLAGSIERNTNEEMSAGSALFDQILTNYIT